MSDKGHKQLGSLQSELAELAARQSREVIRVAGVVLAVLVTLLLIRHVEWSHAVAWGLAMSMGCVMYSRYVTKLAKDSSVPDDDGKLLRIGVALGAVSAVISMTVAFVPTLPLSSRVVIAIFIAGSAASFINAVAGSPRMYVPSLLVLMLPNIAMWLWSPNLTIDWEDRAVLLGLMTVFTAALFKYAQGAYEVFVGSYEVSAQRDAMNIRLEEALSAAESASRAKTRFLASASHDLRQPLHALSLFSGSLHFCELNNRATAIATQIDSAVSVLSAQMDALLDISRLDAGVIVPAPAPVNVSHLIENVLDLFAGQAAVKGLHLSRRIQPDLLAVTDPTMLRRLISNIVSNAVKYTDQGSITVHATTSDGCMSIRIEDSGRGIPVSEHGRIFEEFYQIDNPERDRSQGLGLGLAIVRRLAELLCVAVNIQSEVGSGTRFEVRMMASDEPLESVHAVEQDGLEMPCLRGLVVDDEESIRLGMQTLLQGMGIEVAVATSTDSAALVTRTFDPDFVLADYRLKGTDTGIKTIQQLRQSRPDLPALLVSGDIAPERLREAHDAGIELLHKPVSTAALRESILRLTVKPSQRL